MGRIKIVITLTIAYHKNERNNSGQFRFEPYFAFGDKQNNVFKTRDERILSF